MAAENNDDDDEKVLYKYDDEVLKVLNILCYSKSCKT